MAVRTLELVAEPGEMAVSGIEGFVNVADQGGSGPGGPYHDDVWISILNIDTGHGADGVDGIGHASVDGWGHGLRCDAKSTIEPTAGYGNLASAPCHSQWILVARWLDPQAGVEVPLELTGWMRAFARNVPTSSDPPFSLARFDMTESSEHVYDGAPSVASARLSGTARVTPSSQPEVRHFLLRVPAVLLTGERGFPRLGRIFVGTTVTAWTGPPDEARARLSIGDRSTDVYAAIAGEFDWLALCKAEVACDLPVDLTLTYWQSSGSGKTSSPGASISFDWRIDARLEDFSGTAPLPAELELIERP